MTHATKSSVMVCVRKIIERCARVMPARPPPTSSPRSSTPPAREKKSEMTSWSSCGARHHRCADLEVRERHAQQARETKDEPVGAPSAASSTNCADRRDRSGD